MIMQRLQNNMYGDKRSHGRYILILLLFMIFIAIYTISCNSISTKTILYENSEMGITLQRPSNWTVEYTERNGTVVLTGFSQNEEASALIEITGSACAPLPISYPAPSELLELNIDRIRILYNLETISVVMEPTEVEMGSNDVFQAIVDVPTLSFEEDDIRNQVGEWDPNISQRIELYVISHGTNHTTAYIYLDDNEELNMEAESIVASIKIACTDE
jgi:hypothetical protein